MKLIKRKRGTDRVIESMGERQREREREREGDRRRDKK